MKNTFMCDDSMIITIPVRSLRDLQDGQMMPDQFYCVYRDAFKVLVIKGKPQPLGAVQTAIGLILFAIEMAVTEHQNTYFTEIFTLPCVVFLICGVLSFAAGKHANMTVTKASFSLNVISFFWALTGIAASLFFLLASNHRFSARGMALMLLLSLTEGVINLFLIYWLSKAVFKEHLNMLPTVLLKREE